jgi:hypothetical protein
MTMLIEYLPILILLVVAGGFVITSATVVTDAFGPRRFNRAKLAEYECGIEPTPLPAGEPLRPWEAALADYLPTLRRQRGAAAAGSR